MNSSGLVLIVAGVWMLCQALGGDALRRLNITGTPSSAAAEPPVIAGSPGSGTVEPPGPTTPRQIPR